MCKERPVIVYKNESVKDEKGKHIRYEKVENGKARFLGWGFDTYDNSIFTVAILELPDGHVSLENPLYIRFTDR